MTLPLRPSDRFGSMVAVPARMVYKSGMVSAVFRLFMLLAFATMPLVMAIGPATAQPAAASATAMADHCQKAPAHDPAPVPEQMKCFAACTVLASLAVPIGWPEIMPPSVMIAANTPPYQGIVPDHITPPPRSV